MSKKTSRCSILMLLMMGVITLGFSSIVNAQFHGASIAKGCGPPVRACDNDADCADANECITNTCNDVDFPENIVSCTIEITNIDGFNDTISVNSVADVLTTSGAPVNTPSTDMTIIPLDGATCAGAPGAWVLPCVLPNPLGLDAGRIRLEFGSYNPIFDDVAASPLTDQATGMYFDLCDDPNTEGCDPTTNQLLQAGASQVIVYGCEEDPVECPPGDACNIPFCDPATGCGTDPVDCGPGDACNIPFCDPVDGCGSDPVDCGPGDACNIPFCDPDTGCGSDPVDCGPGDACNIPFCDPVDGCGTDPVDCGPGDACNIPFCDPDTGCGSDPVDCGPGDACNIPFCDPVDGCGTDPVDCPPGDACNIPFCDPVDGCGSDLVVCPPPADPVCFVAICDPVDGCGEVEIMPIPPECQDATLCATPGFWGRRGGIEKFPKSQNITQQVIDSVGFLDVCGVQITNTDLGSSQSAIEGICQSPAGTIERQLFRQLTATALNCVMSGGGNDCTGVSIGAHFAECNAVCTGGGTLDVNTCIDGLDCFNNGGMWDGTQCITGSGFCWLIGGDGPVLEPGGPYTCNDQDIGVDGCIDGEFCQPDENCHDRVMCQDDPDGLCFAPPGPASSSKKCNTARKNPPSLPY